MDDDREKEPSIREALIRNNELLEKLTGEDKKKKRKRQREFKLPFMKQFGAPGKIKRGQCLVLSVLNNGSADINWYPIVDGMVTLKNGLGYPAGSKYILNYKNKPLMIIPEWNERPFNRFKNFDDALNSGELSYPQRVMGELAERKALKMEAKKGFGGKMWIFIVIGLIVLVLAYILISKGSLNTMFGGG